MTLIHVSFITSNTNSSLYLHTISATILLFNFERWPISRYVFPFSFFSEKNDQLTYVDKSKKELKQRLIVEWKNIPLNYLKKITGNMPKRVRYIIEVKDYPTKY